MYEKRGWMATKDERKGFSGGEKKGTGLGLQDHNGEP